jgi:hypothetical protein
MNHSGLAAASIVQEATLGRRVHSIRETAARFTGLSGFSDDSMDCDSSQDGLQRPQPSASCHRHGCWRKQTAAIPGAFIISPRSGALFRYSSRSFPYRPFCQAFITATEDSVRATIGGLSATNPRILP